MDLHKKIIDYANDIKEELFLVRNEIHQNPEIGFELNNTITLVEDKLKEYGYNPRRCGRAGVVAEIGKGNKCILLRADMDALPIKEEANACCKSKNNNMHACGHDMHTVILLGAAKLLKKYEEKLNGRVKIMFQPAEELLQGAKDMIDNGVLDKVDAAMMIHVSTATPFETGSIFVAPVGVSAPAASHFEITINGVSSHGGMPEVGVNPIIAAVNIINGINSIASSEVSINDNSIITITSVNSGNTTNVIPDKAQVLGTIRSFDDNTMNYLCNRINDLIKNTLNTYRCKGKINYISKCPTLINDKNLNNLANEILKEIFSNKVIDIEKIKGKSSGSEDFAYISQEIPAIMISLSAGSIDEGYEYPLHHPKAKFNNEAISTGVIIYAAIALEYLK